MKYILFLFFGTLMFSQNHRFIYEVSYKKDSLSADITKENYHLDIDVDGIMYYNRMYYINDSLFTTKKEYGFGGFKLTSFITKKSKEETYHNYEYIGDVNFYEITGIPEQNWKLGDSIRIFNGFKVQNATAEFGGRKWTAWFCNNIPFPYGPYKFHGLPGLIMELEDTKGDYHFEVIKSENHYPKYERFSLENSISRSIPINQKKLNKLKIELYENPFKYVLNGQLEIPEGQKLMLDDGTILSKSELKPAEKREREKMKADNNPIELDKAVKYPD
ncbi:MAG: GLPGLI family protein [Flavobacteriaceae bacterium]|jgi:GLPGLI family protein|nr:GLPGLI family protein [Flavobacteriaceae bacterium]